MSANLCVHSGGLYAYQCEECSPGTDPKYYLRTKRSAVLFVLGGDDAEMRTIKTLLSGAGYRYAQPKMGWGDHVYTPEDVGVVIVEKTITINRPEDNPEHRVVHVAQGVERVVFVECRPGDGWQNTWVKIIDHHGERAGEPASIVQLLREIRIELELSNETRRWIELIAANDAGYIPAMLAIGATADEVSRVRALEREAQGITAAHESEAEQAIGDLETEGRLTIVHMAHSKTSPVCDRLFGTYDQLLILSGDGEANFYGDGALCAELKTKFGGWSGGSGLGNAGANAYWGGYPSHDEVLSFIHEALSS